VNIAIIGGGPAGLRAAEVAATAGAAVTVFDAKASVGRKFLVAGRGGLNLTHAEPREVFAKRYRGGNQPPDIWPKILATFDADATRSWAAGLGVETFVASTGRVYPREMKGAPLLRRWVQRLRDLNVNFAMHHRWTGITPGHPVKLRFDVDGTVHEFSADAVVLALGGSSWPETGSDGAWIDTIRALAVEVTPLRAANCGWEVAWPTQLLAQAEGAPLKNVVVRAGDEEAAGELMITQYGLEGGAIYPLAPVLREMADPSITIDFKPSLSETELLARLGTPRLRPLLEAQRKWRLSDATVALLDTHLDPELLASPAGLARLVKSCPIQLLRPRPIAEAISSAGGVKWSELDGQLMLRRIPGVFVAGEMIDWEAPTGGYLLQGCLATGTLAGESAAAFRG
jgi:uncharacterized flavoprotein (TIGR03862 family)